MCEEAPETAELAAVICTRNRAGLLRRTLDSLAGQTLARSAFEVVVVDDGSTDDTASVIADYAPVLRLRAVSQRHAGLASAKNHGLFLARAPIVFFMDDDDLAHPELLARHVRAHRQNPSPAVAILGYTALDAALRCDPLMHFVTEVGCFLFSYPRLRDGAALDYTYFWGGRSSCKRALLVRHGVFDQRFKFGCEDIELGFRLSKHGLRVVYCADAISTMVRNMSLAEFCSRLERQGRSNAVFSQLHPEAEIQAWTEVAGAREAWAVIAPTVDMLTERALRVDALFRRKQAARLGPSHEDTEALHHIYWQVCRAHKLKGIAAGLELR